MPGVFGMALMNSNKYKANLQQKQTQKACKIKKKKTLSDFASLEVILEHKEYFPGDKVQGIVCFLAKKDIPFVLVAKLMLHVKGMLIYQESETVNKESFTKNTTVPETEEPLVYQHIFYNHRFELEEGIPGFEKGLYSIPFSFTLHDKVPISINLVDDDINFVCYYKISAYWQKENEQKLKFSINLPVVQKPPQMLMNLLVSKSEIEFRKQFCCFAKDQKTLNIELFASNNIIKQNDELKGFCKLKMPNINLETLFFQSLEIKIMRICRIEFRGMKKKFAQTEVYKQVFKLTKQNTEQTTPESLKFDFRFNEFQLPSVSTTNKYMKLVYVMIASPMGFKCFWKEIKKKVKNEGYLHLVNMGNEMLIKKIEGNKENEDDDFDADELFKRSTLSHSQEANGIKPKVMQMYDLKAELEENLRIALEKEQTTMIDDDDDKLKEIFT